MMGLLLPTTVQRSLLHEVSTAGLGHASNPYGRKLLIKHWHLAFLLFLSCSRVFAAGAVLSCLVSASGHNCCIALSLNKCTSSSVGWTMAHLLQLALLAERLVNLSGTTIGS
jgi:hypothetical protein